MSKMPPAAYEPCTRGPKEPVVFASVLYRPLASGSFQRALLLRLSNLKPREQMKGALRSQLSSLSAAEPGLRIVFKAMLKPFSPAVRRNEFAKGKELS